MKQNKYLIAIDLDGTVVTGFDNYDQLSFALLKELSKSHIVVIATGRPLRSSKYFYDLLELNTPIINYNGALVQNPSNPIFPKQSNTISKADLCRLIHDNQDAITNVFCEIEDNIYLQKDTVDILPYLHVDGGHLVIGDLEEILPTDPNGAIIFSTLGSEQQLEDYVTKTFNKKMHIRFWFADTIVVSEFYNPKTSKASGLDHICKYYQIPRDNVIAIGDGDNDIEMLKYAKISVAMENAQPQLKAVATHITKSVTENGVYHFLKSYFK